MKDDKFLDQKAKDMSIEELISAIKIKEKKPLQIHIQIKGKVRYGISMLGLAIRKYLNQDKSCANPKMTARGFRKAIEKAGLVGFQFGSDNQNEIGYTKDELYNNPEGCANLSDDYLRGWADGKKEFKTTDNLKGCGKSLNIQVGDEVIQRWCGKKGDLCGGCHN